MIVSFLQTSVPLKERERSYEKTNSKNLGELLLRFLELYGGRFAYASTGISVAEGGRHFALGDGPAWRSHGPPPLVIVDPFDSSNNIAASAFGMRTVRALFDYTYARLLKQRVLAEAGDASAALASPLSHVLSSWNGRSLPQPSLLGRDASMPVPHRANFTS